MNLIMYKITITATNMMHPLLVWGVIHNTVQLGSGTPPLHLHFCETINFLGFMISIICICIDIIKDKIPPLSYTNIISNSRTSTRCQMKSNFKEDGKISEKLKKKVETLIEHTKRKI